MAEAPRRGRLDVGVGTGAGTEAGAPRRGRLVGFAGAGLGFDTTSSESAESAAKQAWQSAFGPTSASGFAFWQAVSRKGSAVGRESKGR